MNDAIRRRLLFAVPVACLLAIVGVPLAWQGELPDPMAIHWDLGGAPNGFGSLWATTLLFGALTLGLGVGALVVQRRADDASSRWLGVMGTGLPAFLTAVHLGALQANRVAPTAAEARLPIGALVVGVVVLVGVGLLGWWLSPQGREGAGRLPVAVVEVVPGEAVVWSGTGSAGAWLVALAGGIVLLGVVLGLVATVWGAVGLVLVGLTVASFLRLRVTVGPGGVVVRHGPFGLLRLRVPLEDITDATAEVVEPLAYGGWGYRLRPGVRAIVVRQGAGLRLERVDKPALVVTVDDAGVAAGVLRAHLGQDAPR